MLNVVGLLFVAVLWLVVCSSSPSRSIVPFIFVPLYWLYLVKSLSELGLGFCIRTQQAVTQVDQSTFECSCQHENRLFKVFVTICPLQKYAPWSVQRATINTLNTRHATVQILLGVYTVTLGRSMIIPFSSFAPLDQE